MRSRDTQRNWRHSMLFPFPLSAEVWRPAGIVSRGDVASALVPVLEMGNLAETETEYNRFD